MQPLNMLDMFVTLPVFQFERLSMEASAEQSLNILDMLVTPVTLSPDAFMVVAPKPSNMFDASPSMVTSVKVIILIPYI